MILLNEKYSSIPSIHPPARNRNAGRRRLGRRERSAGEKVFLLTLPRCLGTASDRRKAETGTHSRAEIPSTERVINFSFRGKLCSWTSCLLFWVIVLLFSGEQKGTTTAQQHQFQMNNSRTHRTCNMSNLARWLCCSLSPVTIHFGTIHSRFLSAISCICVDFTKTPSPRNKKWSRRVQFQPENAMAGQSTAVELSLQGRAAGSSVRFSSSRSSVRGRKMSIMLETVCFETKQMSALLGSVMPAIREIPKRENRTKRWMRQRMKN